MTSKLVDEVRVIDDESCGLVTDLVPTITG